VRWLGNRSSGKQGLAIAAEAADRGARVVVVAAHVDDDVLAAARLLPRAEVLRAGTAAELAVVTASAAETADVVVMAAAVADWTPASVADAKLKKDDAGERLTLELVRTADVLAELVVHRREGQVVVGFAAETSTGRDDLIALGRRKIARKPADLLVLNQVGWVEGFGRDESVAVLLGHGGTVVGESSGTKADTARVLLDAVVSLLG
jgi:phosphopantothenoylcysteine decarboxylase/phosphopantothenate--cysteine ligase